MNTKDKKVNFKTLFPHSSDKMLDLLEGMLQYNPGFRSTAIECLQHRIFDKIRVPNFEKPSKIKVIQNINGTEVFDYENSKELKYSMKDLRNLFLNEVNLIKSHN